jgi:cytoskeletal protein CcmA (bactofilin family)
VKKMKTYLHNMGWLVLGIVFLAVSGPAFARSSATIVTQKEEVVSGDKYVRAQVFRNDGTIKGDLMYWAQNISSQGTIEGDAIGAGQDVDLAGNIQGNVRTAGANVNLSGKVEKNVTVFAGVITLARNSVVNGNITAFGGRINLDGKVKGNVIAGGNRIVLSGEFFGNVKINSPGTRKPRFDHGPGESKLTVLPGTIIHGTLIYKGNNAEIHEGAKIGDFQWDKSKVTAPDRQKREIYYYLWKFVRLLVTTAVYFLIGLLLFRLFPTFFERAAAFVTEKPWNALGGGLITMFSVIVVTVICMVLLILSLLMSPAFGIVSSITAIGFYALVFFLATIPVAIWLGTLALREKLLVYRFGTGLIMLNAGLFILMILGGVPAIGPVFSALVFVVKFGVVLLGGGALLRGVRETFLVIKKGEVQ